MVSDGLSNGLRRFQAGGPPSSSRSPPCEPVSGGNRPSVRAARVPILPCMATMGEPLCFMAISAFLLASRATRSCIMQADQVPGDAFINMIVDFKWPVIGWHDNRVGHFIG